MFFLYPYFFNLFSGSRGVSDPLEGGPGSGFECGHLGGGGGGFLYEVAHGFGHGVDQVEPGRPCRHGRILVSRGL